MDLTNLDNQIEVAQNWEKYNAEISLPKTLENDISNIILDYHEGLITSNERYNQILEILNAHFKK